MSDSSAGNAGQGVFARRDFNSKIASIGPGSTSFCSARAARPVADVHEVEELREPALALGFDIEHLVHALLDDLARRVEAELQSLVLEAVPQLDERDELARDVAVLAPAADLVVVELGVLAQNAGAFAFSFTSHFQRYAATPPSAPPP